MTAVLYKVERLSVTKLCGTKYINEYEWVEVVDDHIGRIGISFSAQRELGDVVYVELPVNGDCVRLGQGLAVVESVKTVVDVYAPVSGRVVEINDALIDRPQLINEDPYGDGWLVVVELDDLAELETIANRRR